VVPNGGDDPIVLSICLRLTQSQTMRPMSKPMPSATPTTMPTTVALLMPFELTDPCPRVGSAVPDGAGIIIVLAWPVTVVTLVMASVAVLGDGAGVGEGLELGVGEGDVASVLGCVCATTVLAQFSWKIKTFLY
jgi:hypothetical protein